MMLIADIMTRRGEQLNWDLSHISSDGEKFQLCDISECGCINGDV